MAEPKLRDVLQRIAKELHDDEVAEEFEQLRNRKASWEEVMDAIRGAPPEARTELRQILADEREAANGDEPAEKEPPKPKPRAKAEEGEPAAPPARRRRPGRKSGSAYDWYVDDETGEVVRSPVAVIYSGDDEPDEVEMLDAPVGEEEEGREGE